MPEAVSDDYLYSSGVLYDLMWPITTDIPFWLEAARRYGGPVLEMACGTGRLTIPLAKEGFSVTGIDRAEGMLAVAREKASREGVDVTWVQGDVQDFDLGRRFALIIFPTNALCHLLTIEDFERMAACVLRHLDSGGRFILSVFVPNLRILTLNPADAFPFGEFVRPEDGETVQVLQRGTYHADTQIRQVSLFCNGPDGTELAAGEFGFRMYFPQELDALLKYNGLRIEHKYGDYEGRPFGQGSPQQIPVCVAASLRRAASDLL